jgi:hypothetical protein
MNHLKPLHVKGHINGISVNNMVDSGAIMNLVPYSLYKKLGGMDEELIRTNMTIGGVGGSDPIPAKGVSLTELTKQDIGYNFLGYRGARELQLDSWERLVTCQPL